MEVKCIHCGSANIEPKGKIWHCNTCGKDSDQASVPDTGFDKPEKKDKKG